MPRQTPAGNDDTGRARPHDDLALSLDNPDVREALVNAYEEVERLAADRKAINHEIAAIMEGLQNRGLNKAAVRAAFARMRLNESAAEGFGQSYNVACRALQLDLDIEPPPGETKH